MPNIQIFALIASVALSPLAGESQGKLVRQVRLTNSRITFQAPTTLFFSQLKEACKKVTPRYECLGKAIRVELLAMKNESSYRSADQAFADGQKQKAVELIQAGKKEEYEIASLYALLTEYTPVNELFQRFYEQRRNIWR